MRVPTCEETCRTDRSRPIPHATKIATCCYCGTRAALVLKGRDRQELACSSCGAPLHELKQMPSAKPAVREKVRVVEKMVYKDRKPKKKQKKRKSWSKKFREELFDVIEDIFD